jgi:hypothetical protein
MKLYTEEDLKRAIKKAYLGSMTPFSFGQVKNQILEKLTPIELPSDDELGKEGLKQWGNVHSVGVVGWIDGARWMRNKIQGGNK